jgi:electron transfer flavoprotein beta subunit
MKILVPFKRVPDVASGTGDGAKWVINYFDEIAIEEALRIKERGEADEVVGVTIASPEAEEQIRAALAMGLDRVMRVDDERELDPYAVAKILTAVVQKEKPDVVLMGKQAVDDDASQVGQMLAGRLNWPQATFISKLEFVDGAKRAQCTRETDAGLEVIKIKLPAVITADLRLNEPRYVSLPGLMKAKRRPIELLSLDQLGVSVSPRTTVLNVQTPPRRAAGVKLASVEELVTRLRETEKVL